MERKMKRTRYVLLGLWIGAAVSMSACSGSRSAAGPEPSSADTATEEIRLSDYEDFDVEAYRDRPPERTVSVEHDVPAQLLGGRVEQGVEQLVQGYRIQIYQSLDKEDAFERENEVLAWWDTVPEEERPAGLGADLPVYVRYHQPYYRVRIGDFTSREAAEEVLALIMSRFPGAFVAPDMVRLVR